MVEFEKQPYGVAGTLYMIIVPPVTHKTAAWSQGCFVLKHVAVQYFRVVIEAGLPLNDRRLELCPRASLLLRVENVRFACLSWSTRGCIAHVLCDSQIVCRVCNMV